MAENSAQQLSVFQSLPKFSLLNVIIALCIAIYSCVNCLWSIEGLKQIGEIFFISFFLSSALSFGGYKIDNYFEQRISWVESSLQRLFLTITTYMLYAFLTSLCIISIYNFIFVAEFSVEQFDIASIIPDTFFSVGLALIIISVFIARSWLVEWKKSAIEAEQLKRELLENRYRALLQQLNPHFLFNSLNALSNLVYEDADKSASFIRKLSQIYRYLLDVQYEELIELEKELSFARDYLSLQKIRFEESLKYEIEIGKTDNFYLPPLSIQLLLENAIKHNMFSSKNPIYIRIRQTDDKLVVTNNYQPREVSVDKNTGIGLSNIVKRYEKLSDRKPTITSTDIEFRVELPLLQVKD